MKLNHLNLTVTDPIEARQFLEKYFGLKGKEGGNRGFQVLFDDGGLVLTLIKGRAEEVRYPATFHVGFIQESAPSSYSSAPAATTDACGRHLLGALMRRWYTDLRGSHGRKSPRGIAGRAFRLRTEAARSASRRPPRLLALHQKPGTI